jgi:hypothetical protein
MEASRVASKSAFSRVCDAILLIWTVLAVAIVGTITMPFALSLVGVAR